MKLKETENGNVKVTFTPYELETVMAVLWNCRLGNGKRSDVIYDLSVLVDDLAHPSIDPGCVKTTYDIETTPGDVYVTVNLHDD